MTTIVECTLEEIEAEQQRRKEGRTLADEAEFLSGSLLEFIRAGWHVIEPHTKFVDGWHIKTVCDHLEAASRGEIRRLQVWVPPGTMKSNMCSVMWPAWEWTTNPAVRYLTASYDIDLSTDFAVKTRDLIRSDWYQARWGRIFQLKSDANLKRSYSNDQGGRRFATSPSSGGTGRHAHRILIDDPINAKDADATTQTKLEEVNNWHDGTLSTRWADPKTGVEVIIMQRLHEMDLAGHVLENGEWTVLCLPEEYEPTHPYAYAEDPRTEPGELLWPEHIGPVEHEERKTTMGTFRASGQLQQRPSTAKGEIIERGWWQFFDPELLNDERIDQFPTFSRIVHSWDTAFKDKTVNDYVAGTVWGVVGADRYLLRVFHDRVNFQGTKTVVKEYGMWALERWPQAAHHILIEATANGPDVIAVLKRELTGVQAVPAKGDKTTRLVACQPDFESGNVFVAGAFSPTLDGPDPARTPAIVQEMIDEVTKFPKASHDDYVDSISQALNWVRGRVAQGSVSRARGRIGHIAGIPR